MTRGSGPHPRGPAPPALAVLLLGCAWACRTSPPMPEGEVVTPLHYFETARRSCERALAREEFAALRTAVDHAGLACVRVHARRPPAPREGGPWEILEGSGALISGGTLVLTAGHGIPEGAPCVLDVRTADGARIAADLVDRVRAPGGEGSPDWALLRLRRLPDPRKAAPSLVPGPAEEGAIVAVLGYPGGVGIDARGRVASGSADSEDRLAPIAILARVLRLSPFELEPVAGALPVTGMSGGPVVDERGRILGVVASLQTARGTLYATRLAPVVRSRPDEAGKEGTP